MFSISVFQISSFCCPPDGLWLSERTDMTLGWQGRKTGVPGTGPTWSTCRWAGPFSGPLSGVCQGQLVPSHFLDIVLGMGHESLCSVSPRAISL